MAVVPLDHTRGGGILRGEQTVNLDQFALFDKIINLRFNRRSGNFFCLRSDYEVMFGQDKVPYFIPIRQKPAIQVAYRQVSNRTAINIDIRITNLHIINENVGDEILSNQGDPITQIEIQMGYRRQFPNWTMPPLNADTDESMSPVAVENRLRMFYAMEDFSLQNARKEMDAGLRLTVQVLAVYPETMPPDRVIYIQGIVGTLDYGFRWQTRGQKIDLETYFTTENNFPVRREEVPLTMIEKIFFLYITSRFFRTRGIQYQIYDSTLDPDFTGTEPVFWVRVLNYDAINNRFITDLEFLQKPVAERWSEPLTMPNGIFSVLDALALGVICIVSDKLLSLSKANLLPQAVPQGALPNIEAMERIPNIPFQTYLEGQMLEIQAAFPTIRWYQRTDGSLLIYDYRETIKELETGVQMQRAMRQTRDVLLPAIYDMSIGAIRTIRCPFVGFISTGQRIGFAARYFIGTLIGFMRPQARDAWFRAFLISVIFDTVGKDNMMTISCVETDAPATDVVLATETPGEAEQEEQQEQQTKRRILRWNAIKIVRWENRQDESARTVVAGSWSMLAQIYVIRNDSIKGIETVPEQTKARIADGVAFLLSDSRNKKNNELWFKTRGPSPEMYAFSGLAELKPSLLWPGDEIWIQVAELEVVT